MRRKNVRINLGSSFSLVLTEYMIKTFLETDNWTYYSVGFYL